MAIEDNVVQLPSDIPPKLVGIFGFDSVATLDFIGPLEAFKSAQSYDNYHRIQSCYEVVVIGLRGKTFRSGSGLIFKTDTTIQAIPALDTVVIPGGTGSVKPDEDKALNAWLAKNKTHVRRFAGVCGGIYPLAESGLLDGRNVTTHWRFARDIATRFPKLQVNQTASFLKDGPFYTSGGGTAGIEMTLALINEDYGPRVALDVAREFVMRLRPPGADESVVFPPKSEQESSERLSDLPAWIVAHLHDDLSVEALAEKVCLCPRHFSRTFKSVFETTPAEFVEQLRLGEARRRLLAPKTTIKNVAVSVGFKSADAFRRAFERHLGLTPSNFRARFRSDADSGLQSRGPMRSPMVSSRRGN